MLIQRMRTPTLVKPSCATAVSRETTSAAAGERLRSIDALRGFDMVWILGGGTLVQALARLHRGSFTTALDAQFEHVRWEGFHFYDLIYPLFVFLAGVAIVLSLDKRRRTEAKGILVARILRRGLFLYGLNFIFNGGFSARWPQMRVASGVLALIAVSYVVAALIYLFLADRIRWLAATTAVLLLGYWALLGWVPFPDFRLDRMTVETLEHQAGSAAPAAVAGQVTARVAGVYEQGRNLSNYLDYRLLPGRLHEGYYEAQGLLSPIPGAAVCLLGALAARWLTRASLASRQKTRGLVLAGFGLIGLGLLWGLEFPLVKKLWSSSFCLVAAGSSALLLAAFHQVIDVMGFHRWCTPFLWIGANPIALYLLSALVDFPQIAGRLVGGNIQDFLDRAFPGAGSVALALVTLALMLGLARFLYQRRIFLRA